MTNRVLIVGGRGRIGSSVARDLVSHTDAEITITGRDPQGSIPGEFLPDRVQYKPFDLADAAALKKQFHRPILSFTVRDLFTTEMLVC